MSPRRAQRQRAPAALPVRHGEVGVCPADAVRGGVDVVALLLDAVRRAGGAVVLPDGLPGGGALRFVKQAAQIAGGQDDVVVFGALELVEAEAGALPVEAVCGFGVEIGVAVGAAVGLVPDAGAVPEAEAVGLRIPQHVRQHRAPPRTALPCGLPHQDRIARMFLWLVEDAAQVVAGGDEVVVEEELAARVDLDGPVGDVDRVDEEVGVEDAPALGEEVAVDRPLGHGRPARVKMVQAQSAEAARTRSSRPRRSAATLVCNQQDVYPG